MKRTIHEYLGYVFTAGSGIESLGNQFRTDIEPMAGIHRQDVDRRPPGGSQPDDESAPEREMVSPAIFARVEQGNDHSAVGIDSSEVRSLVRVAEGANARLTKLTSIDPRWIFR
jgi:hypothetical protein